jgi:branched-chain amino acid transport system permease protein
VATGFAGSLFAHHARYLNPNDFTFWKSIEVVIMVAVGGVGSLAGAVVGAFTVVLMPEALRAFNEWRLVIFSVVVIVLMGIGKGGLANLFGIIISRALRAWRRAIGTAAKPKQVAP